MYRHFLGAVSAVASSSTRPTSAIGKLASSAGTAMAESFFASLECELIDRRSFQSKAEARLALFTYIEGWYNPRRRHSALDRISPINFERTYLEHKSRATVQPTATPEIA
jgi:hypothetical protein